MLIRASIANISPALVADGKDWNNILYAVGREPNQKKFLPKSADISILLARAGEVFDEFTVEMTGFAATHINKRNSELHSGTLAFDNVGTSTWLPKFYLCCKCLLSQFEQSLESLFGEQAAKEAEQQIQAFKDEAAKAVQKQINAHETIWNEKSPEDKQELEDQAKNVAIRYYGHRVDCPACKCSAVLHGSPVGETTTTLEDIEICEKQSMLPSSFECVACGLKISGYSKLLACNLGDTFISTSYCDPREYFNIDVVEEARSLMAEDNNEPY